MGVAAAVAGATQGRLDDLYAGGSARGVVLVNSSVTITRSDVRSGNGGNGGAGAAGGKGSNLAASVKRSDRAVGAATAAGWRGRMAKWAMW